MATELTITAVPANRASAATVDQTPWLFVGRLGAQGLQVELQKTATHIQWRLAGGTWANLVALADIAGEPGTNGLQVELQKTATHIQWRLAGGEWANLVALADITGPPGASATPEIGEVRIFPCGAPANWLANDASSYLDSAYPVLAAARSKLPDYPSWLDKAVTNGGAEKFCEALGGTHVGRVWSGGYLRMAYSDDFGVTWTVVDPAGYSQNRGIEYIASLSRLVIGCGSGRIYTSDDGGLTYTRRDVDAGDPMGGQSVNGSITVGTTVYLFGAGGKICKTTDGISYTALTFGDATAILSMAYSTPLDIMIAVTGTHNNCRWSADLGTTWTNGTFRALSGNPEAGIWSDKLRAFLRIGSSNHFTTSGDGKNWSDNFDHGSNFYSILENGNHLLYGSTSGIVVPVSVANPFPRGLYNGITANANLNGTVYQLFKCSNGNILMGLGYGVNYNGLLVPTSYNSATSFRVPGPRLDGVPLNSYIYAGA